MKYRFKVQFECYDCRGESAYYFRVYDIEAENVSKANEKVNALAQEKEIGRSNPMFWIYMVGKPKLLGVVCNCCKGEGVRNVSRRNTTTN